ncbi:MAG TPA: ABC transporter permease [Chloroflexota bacterium]|nr:ABC transporter permease [Chloroflexota bacterium]
MSTVSDVLVIPRPQEREADSGLQTRGMSIGQSLATALEALNANKLRSLLTMLGIIIGVGAVIVMISLGRGASANVAQRLQGLGTNMLMITPGSARNGGVVRIGSGSAPTLNAADARAIQSEISGINGVSPVLNQNVQAVGPESNWSTRVQGVYPDYISIENWQFDAGGPFTDQDEQQGHPIALIGQVPLENLFGDGTPGSANPAAAVGQTIRLNKIPFTIGGVLSSKSQEQDDVILVPFSTANTRLNNQKFLNQVVVQVADASQMDNVQAQIADLLRERHRIKTTDDFTIRNLNNIVQTAQGVTQTLTLLLSGVAAVSLLVGGIGIMNIMLVSVTERTREIGIRSAIGARAKDILAQFLIEAVSLSTVGGVIGILIGVFGSFAISRIAKWNTVIAPESIVLAFAFAAAVGIFFGYYPARKASQLDPIEALRYD